MSWGEIAGLIAAIAFAVLVVFLVMAIKKATKVLDEVAQIAQEAKTSVAVITKDVDNLSIEVEGLLNKANTLVDDLNGKVNKTDPLFTAIGDIGVSVSDVNQSARNAVHTLENKKGKKSSKVSTVAKLGKTASAMNRRRKENKALKQTDTIVY